MAIKANLKKYLKCGSRWQFVPVHAVKGLPKPAQVVIHGEAVKETARRVLPGVAQRRKAKTGSRRIGSGKLEIARDDSHTSTATTTTGI